MLFWSFKSIKYYSCFRRKEKEQKCCFSFESQHKMFSYIFLVLWLMTLVLERSFHKDTGTSCFCPNISVQVLLTKLSCALHMCPLVSQLIVSIWLQTPTLQSFSSGFMKTGEDALLSESHFSSSAHQILLKIHIYIELQNSLKSIN